MTRPDPLETQQVPRGVLAAIHLTVIYVVWGSTYLAIRVAVVSLPPLLVGGLRFLVAGLLLLAWATIRRMPLPRGREWVSLALVGFLLFFVTHGALCWAEKYLASGLAAVLAATLPIITILIETLLFRQQPFRPAVLATAAVGFGGVLVLLWPSGANRTPLLPALAILLGATSWSLGSVLARQLPLPPSSVVRSSLEMVIGGGGLLLASLLKGDLTPAPPIPPNAGLAVLYLITAGSILGFTSYTWLLREMPATKVASYAYVNPIVAVLLGAILLGERLTLQTAVGAALIVLSVILTLTSDRWRRKVRPSAKAEASLSPCS